MLVMEEISKLSKNGCNDALLNYICENYDEIECELNGGEYEEPKIYFSLYQLWSMQVLSSICNII